MTRPPQKIEKENEQNKNNNNQKNKTEWKFNDGIDEYAIMCVEIG